MHTNRRRLTAGWATVLVAGLITPGAAADEKVLLGGGAGIALNGDPCTLTTVGHDSAGALVGFTSAHCGGPGAAVTADGAGGTVGSVVAADDGLDYAVLTFDPAKVTPIPDFDGFAINGIGPDAGLGQWACKQSSVNGQSCFSLRNWALDRSIYTAKTPWQPGDDGAPVTVKGLLIGMMRDGSITLPGMVPPTTPEIVKISRIIDDVNAKGGPGAGFTPIPA